MEYTHDGEQYICGWTIKWKGHLETWVADGESTGMGRFLAIADGKIACRIWVVEPGLKVETGEGYAIQVDPAEKMMTILRN